MRPQLFIALLTIVGTCHAARLDSTYLPPGSAGSAGGAGIIHPPGHGGGGPIKHSGPIGHVGSVGHSGSGSYDGPSGHGIYGGPSGHGGLGSYGEPVSHGSGGFGPGALSGGTYPSGGGSGSGLQGGQEIPIISYNNENIGDGNYQFSYEAGNGITVQETGNKQGEAETVSGSFSYTGPDGVQYSITYTADEYGFHPQGAHLPTPPPIPPEIQHGVELALAAEARGENQDGGYSHQAGGYPSGDGHSGGGHGSNAYQGPDSYQTTTGGGYRY